MLRKVLGLVKVCTILDYRNHIISKDYLPMGGLEKVGGFRVVWVRFGSWVILLRVY